MQQHQPILVPALFAFLGLATSCAVSVRTVHAASCIGKPDAPSPPGEHWYYRTDRTTGRQCWFLGPENVSNQRSATPVSVRPASDAPVQSKYAQQTVAAPPAETETNFPTPTNPPPWPDAAKLPAVPLIFQLAPPTAPAEERQSDDAFDPQPAPRSGPASEPQSQSPAIERSLPIAAPQQSTDDADHTVALAIIVFLAIAIFGSMLEIMRWLHRRKIGSGRAPEWATLNALYRRRQASPGVSSSLPETHIPPLAETEKLAHDLQQILDDLRARPSASLCAPSDLTRSS